MTNVTVEPDLFLYDLDMVDAFQTYLIHIRATTQVGPGPFSPTTNVTRDQKGRLSVA